MTHDPLCTWRQAEEADAKDPRRWLAGGLAVCDCDKIAKVREDERRQSASDYVDGERDMLAKCIEVVGASHQCSGDGGRPLRRNLVMFNYPAPGRDCLYVTHDQWLRDLAALRALQEKP